MNLIPGIVWFLGKTFVVSISSYVDTWTFPRLRVEPNIKARVEISYATTVLLYWCL